MISQDLRGRHCIVTGGNAGIGKVTALELARAGAEVTLACRSQDKAMRVIDDIKKQTGNSQLHFLKLDLASLAKTRDAAQEFLARQQPLDLLINNAGLAGTRGLSEDGFEIHFGVNHLGPYLFTRLLLPLVQASAPARIVNVASRAHTRVGAIDYSVLRTRSRSIAGFRDYCVSKLANVLFNMALAERLPSQVHTPSHVHTYALHPGVVKSEIWRDVPWPIRPLMSIGMLSPEEGAQTTLYCASSPECEAESGKYYDKSKAVAINPKATRAAAEELWARSEAWCQPYL